MFWCICMCMHAYICVCMHACMGVWTFRSMYMCLHMYIHVCAHACVYVHFYKTPPQVLKLASLSLPPNPQILKSFLRIWVKQQFLGHRLKHKIILLSFFKVRQDARSGTDTLKNHTWPRTPHRRVIKHNKTSHKREPRGQPFPSRWPQDFNK